MFSSNKKDRMKFRLLVAIASHGEKNLGYLKEVIAAYQKMPFETDIVVFSNAPKDLPGVKVVVGLPSKNPWSLPFGHKQFFADNLDRYDLFIYSEDDMRVTEDHIQAFLKVTPHLGEDEIAGFLRYEIGPSGEWSLPEVHGAFHWKPHSVKKRGPYTVAEFSNEHAAFSILTQAQLKACIASGGFLRGPCEGKYDMLCTAATDPYTNCGFRKVICISHIDDFLIHHMPNRYAGHLGLRLDSMRRQVETLHLIGNAAHPATVLCVTETKVNGGRWSKSYHESISVEVLKLIPREATRVLCVGSGTNGIEIELLRNGKEITALPLDSVVGAELADAGATVIYGSLESGLAKLVGRTFDCLLLSNLLHLLPDPSSILRDCVRLVNNRGTVLLKGINFDFLPLLVRRCLGKGELKKLKSFDRSGIRVTAAKEIKTALNDAGFVTTDLLWTDPNPKLTSGLIPKRFDRFITETWILKGQWTA
jgi:2-polyprenyl-3-methyl-5-hydroxy-6-metoxy-1,4-benzoquinol methylase